jgi:hypothetical protein
MYTVCGESSYDFMNASTSPRFQALELSANTIATPLCAPAAPAGAAPKNADTTATTSPTAIRIYIPLAPFQLVEPAPPALGFDSQRYLSVTFLVTFKRHAGYCAVCE